MTGDETTIQPTTAASFGAFLTVDELSAYVRIPKNTIYYWRSRSTGPEAHLLGKHLRFSKPAPAGGGGAAERRHRARP